MDTTMHMGTTRAGVAAFACILGLTLGAGCDGSSEADTEDAGTEGTNAQNTDTDESDDGPTTHGSAPANADASETGTEDPSPDDSSGTTASDGSDSGGSTPVESSDSGDESDPADTSDPVGTSDSDDTSDPVDASDTVDDSNSTDTSNPDAAGPTDDGVQDPKVEIEGSAEYSEGLEARDSTFGTDATGDVRWLFTVENTTDAPVCSELLQLKLYDKEGNLIAGNGPDMVVPEDGLPVFVAEMTGSPYRMGDLVTTCIAPGEHGIGRGDLMSFSGEPLDEAALFEKAGRIEYFFARRAESENYVPASDLLTVTDATLNETAEGAVITGAASNGAALLEWTIHAALYDASGKLIDYVSTSGDQWAEGEDLTFELPAADADATSFELYTDFVIWK